jgi:hypothetical protein
MNFEKLQAATIMELNARISSSIPQRAPWGHPFVEGDNICQYMAEPLYLQVSPSLLKTDQAKETKIAEKLTFFKRNEPTALYQLLLTGDFHSDLKIVSPIILFKDQHCVATFMPTKDKFDFDANNLHYINSRFPLCPQDPYVLP